MISPDAGTVIRYTCAMKSWIALVAGGVHDDRAAREVERILRLRRVQHPVQPASVCIEAIAWLGVVCRSSY